MKKLFFSFVLCLASWSQAAAQDTVRIVLDGNTKLLITAPSREDLQKLKYLDINPLVRSAIRKIEQKGDTAHAKDTKENGEEEEIYRFDLRNGVRIVTDDCRRNNNTYNEINVDIGLANWLEEGAFPDSQNKPYGLQSWGSYQASISTNEFFRLGKSNHRFRVGLEFSVYSLRLEGNNYISRSATGDSVQFRDYKADFNRTLSKSRLTVGYLNVPIAFRLGALGRRGNPFMHFEVGGYVGYRLMSYSGIRVNEGGMERTTNSFMLNNWRYGLEASASVGWVCLFTRYDLNPMFASPNAPKTNLWTLGLRL